MKPGWIPNDCCRAISRGSTCSLFTFGLNNTLVFPESSAVTVQGQAVLSQSESESAITHAVSAAAADPSLASLPGDDKQLDVPVSVSSVVTASLAMPIVSSVVGYNNPHHTNCCLPALVFTVLVANTLIYYSDNDAVPYFYLLARDPAYNETPR